MTQDGASSLLQVAPLLWPAPAVVAAGRRGSSPRGRSYLVLPSASNPRRLVPLQSRLAAAASVIHGSSDDALTTRLKATMVGSSLALGVGQRLLRDRCTISTESGAAAQGGSIEDHLAAVFGRPVMVSVRLGPPRANLKPVLEVLTPRGTSLGWAKVGINELTKRLVTHEAAVLGQLTDVPRHHTVVPSVLHLAEWRGLTVLVLSTLPIRGTRRAAAPDVVRAAMVEIALAAGSLETPLRTAAIDQSLRGRIAATLSNGAEQTAEPALRALDELADQTFSFGRWHGDWHPGNMAVGPAGRLMLWDWERSAADVPVGWDALHLHLQASVLEQVSAAECVRTLRSAAPRLLQPFGVPEAQADDVVRLYLGEILTRWTEDRQWAIPWAQALMRELSAALSTWP